MLTRADCTTRNQRKAERCARTYDDLEARIARCAEQEELDAIRPDLDGNQIMEILGIRPGPVVGQAYRFLLSCGSTAARCRPTSPRPSCARGGRSRSDRDQPPRRVTRR